MARHLRLLALQLRISFTLGAQYRWDFLLDSVLSFVWLVLGVVPLYVALHGRAPVGGWTFEEALVVVGWFTIVKAVVDGAVNPSLVTVVDHIRKGTLDFLLLKPVDSQFMVSTAKFELWKGLDVAAGIFILVWAFRVIGRAPRLEHVAIATTLLGVAIAVLYSLWILVVAAAFWVVRLDNLSYLLSSILDFGRWPITLFKGLTRWVFTFVIPLAVMTTYPAEALLGRLAPSTAALAVGISGAFAMVSRWVWKHALAHYTSASS